jgi:gamma-D-glutamyl-L-lysine dipeptidyl-peptidase
MSFAMPVVPVCPMRKEAAHRSEMVSQLLFGELARVEEQSGDFVRIHASYDDYEGWCQRSQLVMLEEAPAFQKSRLSKEWASVVTVNGETMMIGTGTPLDYFTGNTLSLPGFDITYTGSFWDTANVRFEEDQVTSLAKKYLNTAYLWGGRSVFGIDCSGLAQQLFRHFGIRLPRDAYQQAALGETVGFLQESRCGDLAFFDNSEGRITHVGIMLSPETIIHAAGQVRIDPIDNMGIIHAQTGKRTHQLRIIKRYA